MQYQQPVHSQSNEQYACTLEGSYKGRCQYPKVCHMCMTGWTSNSNSTCRGRTWQAFPLSPPRTQGQVIFRATPSLRLRLTPQLHPPPKVAPWRTADHPHQRYAADNSAYRQVGLPHENSSLGGPTVNMMVEVRCRTTRQEGTLAMRACGPHITVLIYPSCSTC